MPRAHAARVLLSDASVRGGLPQRGPLAQIGVTYTTEEAQVAYLLWIAYQRGVHGMLGGKPQHEAIALLANKSRAAAQRAGTFAEYMHALFGFDGLGIFTETLTMDDLLDWSQFCAFDPTGRGWRAFRSTRAHQTAIEAASLLIRCRWLHETHPPRNQAPTSPEGVSLPLRGDVTPAEVQPAPETTPAPPVEPAPQVSLFG